MKRSWRDWINWGDLINGILLVLLADSLYMLPTMMLDPGVFVSIASWLAFIHFSYMIPIMLYLQRRRRFSEMTGISIGSITTLWFCFDVWRIAYNKVGGYIDLPIAVVPPLLGIMGMMLLLISYRRSGSK
jgi:hypothetical protein